VSTSEQGYRVSEGARRTVCRRVAVATRPRGETQATRMLRSRIAGAGLLVPRREGEAEERLPRRAACPVSLGRRSKTTTTTRLRLRQNLALAQNGGAASL